MDTIILDCIVEEKPARQYVVTAVRVSDNGISLDGWSYKYCDDLDYWRLRSINVFVTVETYYGSAGEDWPVSTAKHIYVACSENGMKTFYRVGVSYGERAGGTDDDICVLDSVDHDWKTRVHESVVPVVHGLLILDD